MSKYNRLEDDVSNDFVVCNPPEKEDASTIRYFKEVDKELQHVMWEVWGLMESEEICVVLRDEESDIVMAKKCKSPVVYPHMCDRHFGIDVSDMQLSKDMSNEIFEEYNNVKK